MKAYMIAVLVALGCSVAQAQRSDLDFLILGKSYVISFPSNEQHFVGTTARVSPNPKRMKELTGQEYEIKKSKLEVFTIVQLSGDSWARVEYPERGSDYGNWNLKLNAQAVRADESLLKTLEEKDGFKDHLKYFRWAAEQPIATRQTWINLDHAIEISELRTELIFRRVTAESPVPVPLPEQEAIDEDPTKATTPEATNEKP